MSGLCIFDFIVLSSDYRGLGAPHTAYCREPAVESRTGDAISGCAVCCVTGLSCLSTSWRPRRAGTKWSSIQKSQKRGPVHETPLASKPVLRPRQSHWHWCWCQNNHAVVEVVGGVARRGRVSGCWCTVRSNRWSCGPRRHDHGNAPVRKRLPSPDCTGNAQKKTKVEKK